MRHHRDFDVIVVGTGQAGVPLADRLARAGKRVLVAERGELGGTCTNSGCTPTKTMIASARAAHVARTAGRLGVRVGPVQVDLAAVVARKDDIVRRWREGVQKRLHSGGDRLTGDRGNDVLRGGPGNDKIWGGFDHDRISGGSGNDRINVLDWARDSVRCGSGTDIVFADRVDRVSRDCERVIRG